MESQQTLSFYISNTTFFIIPYLNCLIVPFMCMWTNYCTRFTVCLIISLSFLLGVCGCKFESGWSRFMPDLCAVTFRACRTPKFLGWKLHICDLWQAGRGCTERVCACWQRSVTHHKALRLTLCFCLTRTPHTAAHPLCFSLCVYRRVGVCMINPTGGVTVDWQYSQTGLH